MQSVNATTQNKHEQKALKLYDFLSQIWQQKTKKRESQGNVTEIRRVTTKKSGQITSKKI